MVPKKSKYICSCSDSLHIMPCHYKTIVRVYFIKLNFLQNSNEVFGNVPGIRSIQPNWAADQVWSANKNLVELYDLKLKNSNLFIFSESNCNIGGLQK